MTSPLENEKASMLTDFLNSKMKMFKQKNPRFSFRSMAAKVGISPGAMNEILHGKRPLSAIYAERIAKGLNLPREEFETLLSFANDRRPMPVPQCILTEQEVDLIGNWETYAILSLLNTSDFQDSPEWIARRLGISESCALNCIDILLRLGIVRRVNGKLERTKTSLTNALDVSNQSIIKAHRGDVQKALEMLDKTPMNLRDYSSITMAINPERISEAKKLIAKFRRKMAALLEQDNRKEVYSLAIQLHPLSQLEKRS